MSSRDMYGHQPAEERCQPAVWEEAVTPPHEEDATPPAQEEEAEEEPQQAYEAPDYSDTRRWIKVERPEVTLYVESQGEGLPEIRRTVLTGRTETYFRARTDADGDAEVVREPARNLTPPPPQAQPKRHVWFDGATAASRPATSREVAANRARYTDGRGNGSKLPSRNFIM